MKRNKILLGGFTLVELIVVITILAILSVIGFISLVSYTYYARDGARVNDVKSIQLALGLFQTEKGFYPKPVNAISISYSGTILRNQGRFDDQVFQNVGKISKKPMDPLLQKEYVYSVLDNAQEYEVSAAYESNNIALMDTIIPQANAEFRYAIVKGTYNGRTIQSYISGSKYIFAIPSIINTSVASDDIRNIIQNKQIVSDGMGNIPPGYGPNGGSVSNNVNWNITPQDVVVFSGSDDTLRTLSGAIMYIKNLQTVYSGSIFSTDSDISPILQIDTNVSPQSALVFVNDSLYGGKTQVASVPQIPNLYCWGDNGEYQLGDGTTTTKFTPTKVLYATGVTNYTSFSVGGTHTCAFGNDNKLYCFGSNVNGALGIGLTPVSSGTPLEVSLPGGVSQFKAVSVAYYHTCAVGDNGKAYCWGPNSFGRLGDGTTATRYIPTQVGMPSGVTKFLEVAAGGYHSCGIGDNGLTYCWGKNNYGQVGNGAGGWLASSFSPDLVWGGGRFFQE